LLTDPVVVQVNYTTTLSPNPDLEVASENCGLGHLMLDVYKTDLVGQAQYTLLAEAIAKLAQTRTQYELFLRVYNGLSAYRPPAPPPPPPPSPPPLGIDGPPAPPAAPRVYTFLERIDQFREDIRDLEAEVAARNADIGRCIPSSTNTCGRDQIAAPNPWLSEDGEPCVGYTTHEAFEGAFCGYWNSDANVDAAEPGEVHGLLTEDGAP